MDRILIRLYAMIATTLALAGALVTFAATAFAQPSPVTVVLPPENQVGEFVAAVQAVVNEYPTDPFTISTEPLDPIHYVGAAPGRMVINSVYVNDGAQIEEDFNYDVSMGYHSPGCSPQTYLGIHEAAHQIDYTHGMRARQVASRWAATIPDSRADELSGYSFNDFGFFNPSEALAEAFASVKCDPAGSTPAEHDLFNILVTTQ